MRRRNASSWQLSRCDWVALVERQKGDRTLQSWKDLAYRRGGEPWVSRMAPNNRRCMSSGWDTAGDVCSKEEQVLLTAMWGTYRDEKGREEGVPPRWLVPLGYVNDI